MKGLKLFYLVDRDRFPPLKVVEVKDCYGASPQFCCMTLDPSGDHRLKVERKVKKINPSRSTLRMHQDIL